MTTIVEIIPSVAPVSIRTGTEGNYHRETRVPGADLSDLPADIRQQIEAHWTTALVSAWHAQQDAYFNRPTTAADVNTERQRRVIAGKIIDGVYVTGRDEDARNLTNLALAAQLRITQGDTTTPTTFRDGNNVDHDLTPPQVLSLWQQSAAYVSALYEASWQIKAMEPLPEDVTVDEMWPSGA